MRDVLCVLKCGFNNDSPYLKKLTSRLLRMDMLYCLAVEATAWTKHMEEHDYDEAAEHNMKCGFLILLTPFLVLKSENKYCSLVNIII